MSNTTPPAAPKRWNRTEAIIIGSAVAVIAAIITTGIVVANPGDGDSQQDAKVTAGSPEPATTGTKPNPKPSPQTFKLGDTIDIDAGGFQFSATAFSYTDKGITGVPELLSAGQKWAVAMVKVCNAGDEAIEVSPFPWSLAYSDGVRAEAAGTNAGDLPQPLYPMDAKVKSGDCVRGNVVFQVPTEERPERVLYSPGDVDEPVEWQLGK